MEITRLNKYHFTKQDSEDFPKGTMLHHFQVKGTKKELEKHFRFVDSVCLVFSPNDFNLKVGESCEAGISNRGKVFIKEKE